jgi:hypothetical protein
MLISHCSFPIILNGQERILPCYFDKKSDTMLCEDEVECVIAFIDNLCDWYNLTLTCKLYSQPFLHDYSHSWIDKLSYFTQLPKSSYALKQYVKKYGSPKLVIREFLSITFEMQELNQQTLEQLQFKNNNRTIVKVSDKNWATVRSNLKLKPGEVYTWDLVLNEYKPHPSNTFNLLIGIESGSFDYMSQVNIIGHSSLGFSVNLGTMNKCMSKELFPVSYKTRNVKIKSGDIFTFKLDIKGSKYCIVEEWNADFKVLLNNREFTSFPAIDLRRGRPYYPAISMIGECTITIRPSYYL